MIPEPYNEISNKIDNIIQASFAKTKNEIIYYLKSLTSSIDADNNIINYIQEYQNKINTIFEELINNPSLLVNIITVKEQLQQDKEHTERMQTIITQYYNDIENRQKTLNILDEQLRNVAHELNKKGSTIYRKQAEDQAMLNRCKEVLDAREKDLIIRERSIKEKEDCFIENPNKKRKT